jgi:hypothetical protein
LKKVRLSRTLQGAARFRGTLNHAHAGVKRGEKGNDADDGPVRKKDEGNAAVLFAAQEFGSTPIID